MSAVAAGAAGAPQNAKQYLRELTRELKRHRFRDYLRQPRAIDPRRPLLTMDLADVPMPAGDPDFARCFIRPDYEIRSQPEYYVDDPTASPEIWQPDVYRETSRIATRYKARRIVDIGSGSGEKLVPLHSKFEIVGVDFGQNVEHCRTNYAFGTWVDHDLGSRSGLPLAEDTLSSSVVVCSDVIEHLQDPHRLLDKLRRALDHAHVALVSTPEREITWGKGHTGPPPNVHHVREWSLGEFASLLRAHGFQRGRLGVTRSHDLGPHRATILAILPR